MCNLHFYQIQRDHITNANVSLFRIILTGKFIFRLLLTSFAIEKIDIFKIDIEGAEKEIFKESDWLEKVKLLIIETYNWLEKGCSKSVFNALKNKNFSTSFSGEKFVIQINE